jgi:hypothetical protein
VINLGVVNIKWTNLRGFNGVEDIFFMLQPLAHLFSTLIDVFSTFLLPPTSIDALDGGKVKILLL